MTRQIPERVTVKLKFRNNRTLERSQELVEVAAPGPGGKQAAQLAGLVEERWPGAELRVFHDGAATFTRGELHMVAVYVSGSPAAQRRPETPAAAAAPGVPADLPLTG